jgi:hypothetical protein
VTLLTDGLVMADPPECAYCVEATKNTGPLLTKWGWANSYECSVHGQYFILDSPMSVRGQQIGPVTPK